MIVHTGAWALAEKFWKFVESSSATPCPPAPNTIPVASAAIGASIRSGGSRSKYAILVAYAGVWPVIWYVVASIVEIRGTLLGSETMYNDLPSELYRRPVVSPPTGATPRVLNCVSRK